MTDSCIKCGERGYVRPLHGDRGGPPFCGICAGKWHAEFTRRRKWGRIIAKAMKCYLNEGGRWTDFDKMRLSASGFVLPGYGADTIGSEVGDITSEILTDALSLTHPDRHPPERRELAQRVTQELLGLRPFVFPAPKPQPTSTPPPRNRKEKVHTGYLKEPLRVTFPCELCTDDVPYYYCTDCRAEWDKRQAAENKRQREQQRRWYAQRRRKQIAARPPTTCATCGEQFKAKRKDARYCSNVCRQQAHRQRKASPQLNRSTSDRGRHVPAAARSVYRRHRYKLAAAYWRQGVKMKKPQKTAILQTM